MTALFGFIGLGNMGRPMAANMAGAGHDLLVYDKAGIDLSDLPGARQAQNVQEVWHQCKSVFLSLPDGTICKQVLDSLPTSEHSVTRTVIDLSTIGISCARDLAGTLAPTGISYVDCPVSGGVQGARAGTITLIWAGPGELLQQHRSVLESFSGNIFHIHDQPGYGQAMKLINNFLSASNMAATAEAMAYGVEEGLDLSTMLDVVNVSTGYNSASRDKFPKRIATQSYDAGFSTVLMSKDVQLFREGMQEAGMKGRLSPAVADIWSDCKAWDPGCDITEIYKYLSEALTDRA